MGRLAADVVLSAQGAPVCAPTEPSVAPRTRIRIGYVWIRMDTYGYVWIRMLFFVVFTALLARNDPAMCEALSHARSTRAD